MKNWMAGKMDENMDGWMKGRKDRWQER